jgi:glycosyltransferase involved in cell wall biosynthesis
MNFSVLMSVYKNDNPQFLQEAINSILRQTLVPAEIVIIIDGKVPEEIETVLDKYKNKYGGLFNIIQLKQNVGLALALRTGVLNCKYDLVARMDHDDICREDRFEKEIARFIENDDISMVGSYAAEFYDDVKQIISIRKVPLGFDEVKKFARKRNPMNHMTVVFKKKAVLDCGNYKEFLLNEDYYTWVRMIVNGHKIINIPEPLVYARTGPDMYKRRGGIKYAKRDYLLEKEFYNMGFITFYEMIVNMAVRIPVRLMPNKLRELIYLKYLRK